MTHSQYNAGHIPGQNIKNLVHYRNRKVSIIQFSFAAISMRSHRIDWTLVEKLQCILKCMLPEEFQIGIFACLLFIPPQLRMKEARAYFSARVDKISSLTEILMPEHWAAPSRANSINKLYAI